MLPYMAKKKKKDVFTELTKLIILKWEDYPELSGWMLRHHHNPYKSQPDNSVRMRGHVPMKAEVWGMHSLAGIEDGGRGPAANECQQARDAGKGKETPRAPEGTQSCGHLDFSPFRSEFHFRLRTSRTRIHVSCSELLNVWSFITAAMGNLAKYYSLISTYAFNYKESFSFENKHLSRRT